MSVQGEDLGLLRAGAPDWSEGDRIHLGLDLEVTVVRFVGAEQGDLVDGYLIVERPAKV